MADDDRSLLSIAAAGALVGSLCGCSVLLARRWWLLRTSRGPTSTPPSVGVLRRVDAAFTVVEEADSDDDSDDLAPLQRGGKPPSTARPVTT